MPAVGRVAQEDIIEFDVAVHDGLVGAGISISRRAHAVVDIRQRAHHARDEMQEKDFGQGCGVEGLPVVEEVEEVAAGAVLEDDVVGWSAAGVQVSLAAVAED